MNIGIVGQGFVGTAVYEGLKQYHKIETYDIAKASTCKSLEELVETSDVIFVCLPTPMKSNGSCHIGIVEDTLLSLDTINKCKTVVVKSTVSPGTTEMWNKKFKNIQIVFNPEFLTEANSIEDFKNQNRIIIGANRKVGALIKSKYSKVFPKVPIIKTSSTIAEMVKYFTNCFLAMKVSYANEMYQICEKLDIDYDKVVEYAVRDERIGISHLNVPGPDGDFGFGGHCFPKDLNALIHLAEKQGLGLDINVLKAILDTNNRQRSDRDWEEQKGRAVI